jgi:hypothetical protein
MRESKVRKPFRGSSYDKSPTKNLQIIVKMRVAESQRARSEQDCMKFVPTKTNSTEVLELRHAVSSRKLQLSRFEKVRFLNLLPSK